MRLVDSVQDERTAGATGRNPTVSAMSLFLTSQQLREMTGLAQAAAQIRWLRKNGVRHWVRADGRPTVLISALEGRQDAAARAGEEPNFAAIRRAR